MKINQPTLAIDPGYDRMGWAVGGKVSGSIQLIEYGCAQTDAKDSLAHRYQAIITYLTKIIKEFEPSHLAIESVFFSKNQKTAMKVAEVRGIIIGICLEHGLEYSEYNPGSIKLAVTGNGRADKRAVEKMVRLECNLLNEPIVDDAVDAIAVLMTHLYQPTQISPE
ncbi:MAG: crossover junction endodeoxyribonuclease RuvC [Pseudomonadales bacterium]|nr:crossover junction endodeoxyribonuclease RuvC [Candidatus Woesebacteria bacterium]MCB9802171.1 crossover junction endodeoxyribonuclease RuvC [Pseudomonadales bacterium]